MWNMRLQKMNWFKNPPLNTDIYSWTGPMVEATILWSKVNRTGLQNACCFLLREIDMSAASCHSRSSIPSVHSFASCFQMGEAAGVKTPGMELITSCWVIGSRGQSEMAKGLSSIPPRTQSDTAMTHLKRVLVTNKRKIPTLPNVEGPKEIRYRKDVDRKHRYVLIV